MYLVNSNLAKSNSFLTRTKLVSLDRNLPQGAATAKAFIEDMASSGFSENKGLGGVHSLAGSRKLQSSLVM